MTVIDQPFIASLIKPRDPASHKGTHGHALLIAGNKGKMGAAVIAAKACLRTGVGLLTVNVPAEERNILQSTVPEAMLMMREEGGELYSFSAIGIGPAIGTHDTAVQLLENLLENYQRPVVLDADALTILAGNKSMWGMVPPDSVLTPHPGEFDRMFGPHNNTEERQEKALELSLLYPWVIVLKGQHTQVAYKGKAYINSTGNAGLAKGGSGDALTGMTLSLQAQQYPALEAAMIAVYLHGLAADIALDKQSPESLVISDVIGCIGKAFNETKQGAKH